QTFTVTITAVNDAPCFVKGPDISVYEDSGGQTFVGWAGSISTGPSDEANQTLSFVVSNNNSNLFSVAPTISTNGTLTFTPTANTNGSATVTVTLRDNGGTANGGSDTSATKAFLISVTGVNDAPIFNAISDLSILEDAARQTVTVTGVAPGTNEASQTLMFSASSSDTNLISGVSIAYTNGNSTACLRFTPVTNANGTATITLTAQDNGGTSNGGIDTFTRTFNVVVNAVNDRPTLNSISDVSVYEGSSLQTISLTGITAGPSDEAGQAIVFTAASSNTNLVPSPVVTYTSGSSASLAYTPASAETGTATVTVTAQDNGGIANGGTQTFTRTFTITVIPINHAPTLDVITNRTVLEDAGTQSIALTGISTGLDESGQILTTFAATSSNTNLISSASVSYTNGNSTAVLRFTPVANSNGTASITISLQDDGGTANSGSDVTTRSFDVTITAVNDAPDFEGTNVLVRTTTAAQTVLNWATSMNTGPVNESAQALSFQVSNDNNAMFSVQPTVSTNGTLTFTPTMDGTANLNVYLQDDGGTANGGTDTTVLKTFTITVAPINIAPSFSMNTNLTVLEDTGAQAFVNWATNIIAGPSDESGQALSFVVTNDNNSLFAVQPALSTNGTLTFVPADNAFGAAMVTVLLQDDGGTAYGGSDTSSAQTFLLNITPINDAPSFVKGLDVNLVVTASRYQEISGWASNISAGSNEAAQILSFVVTNDTPEIFRVQPSISSSGTLKFEIASGAPNVLATITVQLLDNGGIANGGTDASALQTFHISLSSSYGTPTLLTTGRGPTGLYLGNLRGLTFAGATKSGGPRYRDIIVANYLDNTVNVRFCNDNGTFTDATTYPVGLNPFGVISGDLDRDGYEEIVTANNGTNTISVLQNNIDRTFAPAVDYVVGNSSNPEPIAVMVNDFNLDGRLDVVVANHSENSVSVLLGLGNTTFGAATNFAVGSGPMSVWTGDLDGDKKTDILTADKDGNTLTILPGLGNGAFGTAQTISLPGNPQPTYAIPSDLNGDGKLDIVVANYAANTVSVLLKKSDGSFQVSSNYLVGINPRSVLARDLNRDGKIDIACANSGSGSISILLNRGDGTFESGGNFPAGGNPLIVWGSNFDDDDATDLAISNYGDNTISILRYGGPLAYNSQVSLLEDHTALVTLKGRILSGNSLNYQVSTNPAHGTLSGTGSNLTYTPATNYSGIDTFSYQVTYTADDLILNSANATVTLKITPVNDAPIFNLSAAAVSLTNFNTLETIPGFATGISPGATEEAAQLVGFTLTTTNRALFDIQPKLTSNGILSFRPALNKEGVAVVSVRLADNGGTLYGGTNGTALQTFTITVLPNPLMSLKGAYSGLFYESSGIATDSAGFFSLILTDKRTFSGRLLTAGKTYPLAGTMNTNGIALLTIPRTNQSSLTATFILNLTGGANDQITGNITDGTWTADLLGDRNVFNALTNPSPYTNRYTMAFGGNPGNPYKPAGDGIGTITIRPDGTLAFGAALADATAISQTTAISKNGMWPFYASLYNGNGVILGWLTFTNTVDSSLEGDVRWIKTGAVGGKYYPTGFTNDIVAVGSTFITPSTGSRALNLTNALVEFNGGNFPRCLTNRVTLNTNNTFTVTIPNTNSVSVTLASTTGLIGGGVINPLTKAKVVTRGIILQKQNAAYGFFLGTNRSGLFLLHE
ncbi:MAG: tandem-95 repeat protein, partial [Verrucomicrobiales bacterium]|nr:tandem-95 repeat protein [Verrucomicrobiales bacterium]